MLTYLRRVLYGTAAEGAKRKLEISQAKGRGRVEIRKDDCRSRFLLSVQYGDRLFLQENRKKGGFYYA